MPDAFRKLVIVASDCPTETVSALRGLQERDRRVELLIEDRRYGKADAINKIIDRTDTPLVIFANSDARPEAGAIQSLLSTAYSDRRIGAASAVPIPEQHEGVVSLLVNFMWTAHNMCSISLNHMNISNHSCDEMVLFRLDAVSRLPRGLVNDGAFLAVTARLKGYAVKVSPRAKVHIRTPKRISEVILQRRRILFGHAQVWREVGTPPKTIESLLLFSPSVGLRILVQVLAQRPRLLCILPLAFVTEVSAALLSIYDRIRSTKKHAVWRRFT